jgi:hypothetical protein
MKFYICRFILMVDGLLAESKIIKKFLAFSVTKLEKIYIKISLFHRKS